MGALGKHRDRVQELGDLAIGVAVTEYGKSERRLGDEHVARDEFERRTGRVRGILVVARSDDGQSSAFDRDLGGAKHVAGRMERQLGAAQSERLAGLCHLRGTGEIVAVAEPHQVERLLRGQHRAVARPRVVGVAVGDHGLVDRTRRIDMETADLAAHAGRRRRQKLFGAHCTETHGAEICHIGPGKRSTMPAQPLFVSSGDLVADRRYQWALDYLQRGDAAAAADILVQVLETAPGFATAWFALASIREAIGDRDGAIAAFAAARDADREDYHGARLHLARLGVGEATPSMTGVYVRRLFDQHAPDFDTALVERLEYRGPELLLEAVRAIRGTRLRLGSVLDLGCGTGLGGAAFRPFCDWLVGVDISPGMIEQARAKGLYDRLVVSELLEFLDAEAGASHHLALAADVFVYCSDLAPIATAVAKVLAPGGLFAFTVETHDDPGVRLQGTLRYAHGAAHVRQAITAAGLELRQLAAASTRNEKGAPVAGLLVVASTPPSSPSNSNSEVGRSR